MLKTVKNGSGIGVDPPPCFFKIPTFSRFFFFGSVPYYNAKPIGYDTSITTDRSQKRCLKGGESQWKEYNV